jgi:glycosyltransferase involved in cell wall biosynthesis
MAYRLMAGAPDAVFAVSELVRRHAIEVDRIDPSRVQTIYNGLDFGDWSMDSHAAKAPGEFVITTVGNIRRVKGHDVFIRAAAAVVRQFPRATFSIAGEVLERDYFTELQTLVRELNLADHVRFEGGVRNLRPHLAAADIFVLPSRSEGFSNAIVEAMAACLPVVATTVGGNPEAVSAGINGILVPPDDPDALSTAILRLLSDPAKAKAMGEAGRELAAEKFTTVAMMNQVTGTYRKLLSGR